MLKRFGCVHAMGFSTASWLVAYTQRQIYCNPPLSSLTSAVPPAAGLAHIATLWMSKPQDSL